MRRLCRQHGWQPKTWVMPKRWRSCCRQALGEGLQLTVRQFVRGRGELYEAFINSLFIDVLLYEKQSLFGISESSLKAVGCGEILDRCAPLSLRPVQRRLPAYAIDVGRCLRRDPQICEGFLGKIGSI